jgi:hypothetical protein
MAKIIEELVIVKLSKLVRDDSDDQNLLDNKTINNIEQVVQEIVGDGVVIEIVKE